MATTKKQVFETVEIPPQGGTVEVATPEGERRIEVMRNRTGCLEPSKDDPSKYRLQRHYTSLGWEITGFEPAPKPDPRPRKGLSVG